MLEKHCITQVGGEEWRQRTSVNNDDNLRVQWDLSDFYPILLMCMIMASVHRLPLFFEVLQPFVMYAIV